MLFFQLLLMGDEGKLIALSQNFAKLNGSSSIECKEPTILTFLYNNSQSKELQCFAAYSNSSKLMGLHRTEVTFVSLTQQPRVQISTLLNFFL